ncbi:MAG: UvrD-helicase domain-containing protein, partial [Candidatus Cryptobacteroides sp.]
MLKILKASAGSGKTFTLAGEYIRLLFAGETGGCDAKAGAAGCDPYSYRHILAVTFTNKATDEMKSRILKELHILATEPEKSSYIAEIMEMRKDLIPVDIARMARRFLCNILNDYGAFSVSTIDSFFQRTLKAFSREIGQFSSYQVELDKASLVKESVDRILDALTEKDKNLLKWLSDSVMEQLNADGRFSIEDQLYEMANALHDEGHRTLAESLNLDDRKIYSRENLGKLRVGCRNVIDGFAGKVSAAATSVLDALDKAKVKPEDFNRKFLAKIRDYTDLSGRTVIGAPTEAFLRSSADPEKWFAKSKAGLRASVEGILEEPLGRFCDLFNNEYKTYKTALTLLGQIYSLGLAGELEDSFNELVKEKNVLSIDDSNTILRGIIDGSDAPFIYEKIGVRYDHFLLDEFQDTSGIQWENFRPLLAESLAGGNANLIVGDV